MRETSLQSSARFCPGCGERTLAGASFCSACGKRLTEEPPAAHGPPPLVAVVVLVGFLTVGLALWVTVLAPAKQPSRIPLAQKPREEQAASQAPSGAKLPVDHPPLEIPGDVKQYIADLEAKAAARPNDPEAWKAVAQVEYRAGQIDRGYLDKAEASFRHALALNAKDLDSLRGLGNVHFDRERYPEAIESYGRYLAIKPDDLSVRTDLGTMYLYGGNPEKAIAEYDKVLAKDSKFYQAHYNLGIAYAQSGQTPKALESLARARDLAPDERTRAQIDSMIDQAKGGAGRPGVEAAPQDFHARVEDGLRSHPIVGPKIVRFEWSSPTTGQLRLREFPMQGMPEMVRQKFLDHLKTQLADAKRASASAGTATLDLVDDQSGQVMATVKAE